MRTRPKLVELLKFGKHRTPGFGINQGYYLSVLASRMPLPSLRDVVCPKESSGAVKGFGVPLSKEATKDCLGHPMERGAYAIAAPDQKTVLRLLVLSKEEASFCPAGCVESALALNLTDEVRGRLLATWSIAQLSFEAHHPMVFPAVNFALRVASRIAQLTDGLVADPVSRAYRLPDELPSALTSDGSLDVRDVVTVKTAVDEGGCRAYTLGMQKFGLPEYEVVGFAPALSVAVQNLLYAVSQGHFQGEGLSEGDTLGSAVEPLTVVRVAGAETLRRRIVAEGPALDRSLAAWIEELTDEQTTSV